MYNNGGQPNALSVLVNASISGESQSVPEPVEPPSEARSWPLTPALFPEGSLLSTLPQRGVSMEVSTESASSSRRSAAVEMPGEDHATAFRRTNGMARPANQEHPVLTRRALAQPSMPLNVAMESVVTLADNVQRHAIRCQFDDALDEPFTFHYMVRSPVLHPMQLRRFLIGCL